MGELLDQAPPPRRPALAPDLVRTDLQQAPSRLALVEPAGLGAQVGEQAGGILLGVEARRRETARRMALTLGICWVMQ